MRIPPRRQLLLAGVVVVAVVSTVFVAGASGAARHEAAGYLGRFVGVGTDGRARPGCPKTGFKDQTVRMTVHTSVGGDEARIRISNAYGMQTITVGHATVAMPTKSGSGDVMPGTMHEVQFCGVATA